MSAEAAGHAVIVGASLAGLHAAEAARRGGFAGRLTLVGAEPHRPYDRPPLSKSVLTGEVPADATTLPHRIDLDAEWRLGVPAQRLDREGRRLHLADGSSLDYDRLLVATGARARPWPDERERALHGVHTIRGRDDAARLRAALVGRPERVVVIGAGFIGCEVSHVARGLGLPVALIDRGPAPLARVLGTALGDVVAAHLRASGVDLRFEAEIERLEDDGRGAVRCVRLKDGEAFETTCVVVALGSVRNTEWLAGSGLSFDGGGLDCDAYGHALDEAGVADPCVLVAGDVARFPHPLFGRLALEHWDHAVAQGTYAGGQLAGAAPEAPYTLIPAFWSTQGALSLKSVGLTQGADAIAFAQGDPKSGRFLVAYGRKGRCVAAVAFDAARWLPAYAELIAQGAPFPPVHGGIDLADLATLAPGFPAKG